MSFILNLNSKDVLTLISILITAGISVVTLVVSYKNYVKNNQINTVSKERLESLTLLKNDVSSFLTSVDTLIYSRNISDDNLNNILNRSYKIAFQLNSKNKSEKEVSKNLNDIRNLIKLLMIKKNEDESLEITGGFIELSVLKSECTSVALITQTEIEKEILNNFIEVSELLMKHIKSEWEKIKKEVN